MAMAMELKPDNIMNVEVKCLKFVDCPYCGDRQEWDYISTQTCGECCSVYQVVKATNEKRDTIKEANTAFTLCKKILKACEKARKK